MNERENPAKPAPASERTDVLVGRRLRALRLERGLSLAGLSAEAGISIGALSQIERGLSSLRLRFLWPIAAALDIEPSTLLGDSAEPASDLYCVRASARRDLPVHSEGVSKAMLSPPGAVLNGMLVEVEPGGGTEAYAHSGHEFGLVLEGAVELVVDEARYRLEKGDSFAFKSTLRHAFRNTGTEKCTIVWVNTRKAKNR